MAQPIKMVLAPAGCGKTTWLEFINNPNCAGHGLPGNPRGFIDADDVLKGIKDTKTGENLINAMAHYIDTEGLGWDKWHRVCFRALIKEQHEKDLGRSKIQTKPLSNQDSARGH